MYFYIDESGQTGPNLFDPAQPMLYYGVLFSRMNVDELAPEHLQRLRTRCGVERLHAAELGNRGLALISEDLIRLQAQLDLTFDLYRVNKADHSVISFFDQVFDQGMNPAVTWSGYWTPLRYVLLLKLAGLFDEDLAKRAWDARLELNDMQSNEVLIAVCRELRARVHRLPDARSRQLISDVLEWAEENPGKIYYNTKTKKDRLSVMPNIIGFQAVMIGIATRLRSNCGEASRIIVDQQSQFNKSQKSLYEFYVANRSVEFLSGFGLPEMNLKDFPTIPIEFSSSTVSAGLELADVYLWILKRILEKQKVAPALRPLVRSQLGRGETGEISLSAIAKHWIGWFNNLPEPSPEQMNRGRELVAEDETRRLRAIRKDRLT